MHVRCGVKRGAVGVVLKGYALPLWSSGPNGAVVELEQIRAVESRGCKYRLSWGAMVRILCN